MAATSWAPAADQDGSRPRVVSARINARDLDALLTQTVLPVAMTPLTTWLFQDAGYVPPVPPRPRTSGRGWPV